MSEHEHINEGCQPGSEAQQPAELDVDNQDQRRAAGRIMVQGVRVSKGVVIDASSGGMRIRGKTPRGCGPGSVIRLEVSGDDGSVTLDCEVRWMQRHPLRGATFGVSFVDLSDADRRELFGIIRRSGTETRCRWMAA